MFSLSRNGSITTENIPCPDMHLCRAAAGDMTVCAVPHPEGEAITLNGDTSVAECVSIQHVQDAVMYLFACSIRQMSEICITVCGFLNEVLIYAEKLFTDTVRHFSVLRRLFICCFRL